MADPYWDPIFARLQDDLQLLRMIAVDLDQSVLLDCASHNPPLQRRIAPYVKSGRIARKGPFADALMKFAANDEPLRRVLFFSWLTTNSRTMNFPTIPADSDSLKRLRDGEFGVPAKIAILSRIDPRESAKPLYDAFMAVLNPAPRPEPEPKLKLPLPLTLVQTPTLTQTPTSTLAQTPTPTSTLPQTPTPTPTSTLSHTSTLVAKQVETASNALSTATPSHVSTAETPSADTRLSAVREELRGVRKQLRESEKGLAFLQTRLSRQGEEVSCLRKTLAAAQEQADRQNARIASVREELEFLKSNPQILSDIHAPDHAERVSQDLPVTGSQTDFHKGEVFYGARNRIRELEALLSRKSSALERLKNDLDKARADLESFRDQARQIANLQVIATRNEADLQSFRQTGIGRVVTRCQEGGGGEFLFLVETSGGGLVKVPESGFQPPVPVEGEWVLLSADLKTAWSLESRNRQEFIGFLARRNDAYFLESDGEPLPVLMPVAENHEGRVAKGVFLPALGERRPGIRALQILSGDAEKKVGRFATYAAIQRFWRLISLDRTRFSEFLEAQGIPFRIRDDGVEFDRDFRLVLGDLRGRLSVALVCEKEACRVAAKSAFLQKVAEGQVCSVCLEETAEHAELNSAMFDFKGSRVVIVGGDIVGSRYHEAFAKHGLKVEWSGGFSGPGGLREGLGGAAALVVVLKQVSHTLLRELLPAAHTAGVPVLFSQVRGVSGVLRELVEFLRPTRL